MAWPSSLPRLPADERAGLIEGLVRSLDEGDQLDEADRARLHEAIRRSEQQFRDGEGIPAEVVLARYASCQRHAP